MSRLTLEQILLNNLSGVTPVTRRDFQTKEQALEELKDWTKKDFGYDVGSWRSWLKEHPIGSKD